MVMREWGLAKTLLHSIQSEAYSIAASVRDCNLWGRGGKVKGDVWLWMDWWGNLKGIREYAKSKGVAIASLTEEEKQLFITK